MSSVSWNYMICPLAGRFVGMEARIRRQSNLVLKDTQMGGTRRQGGGVEHLLLSLTGICWGLHSPKQKGCVFPRIDWPRARRSGESNLGGARFSAPVQTGLGAHPVSCTMGTGSFPGVKRSGRGVNHLPPFSTEVKERVKQYPCLLCVRGLLQGEFYFLYLPRRIFQCRCLWGALLFRLWPSGVWGLVGRNTLGGEQPLHSTPTPTAVAYQCVFGSACVL
jgi:hypothetical protein